jgi:hypothetical protein
MRLEVKGRRRDWSLMYLRHYKSTTIQGFSESRYTRTRKSRRLFFFVFTSSIPHPVDKSSVVSSSASEKVQRNRNKND